MKHKEASKAKVKELRLTCYVLGQEKVASVNSFTLEGAHKFLIRTRIPEKGKKTYLKRHKSRLETHYENGLHFTKVKDLTSVLLHQPWIKYEAIHRFFVFEAESHEILLGITLINNTFYFLNLHFKEPVDVIQLCDYIEQTKVMSGIENFQEITEKQTPEHTDPPIHVINYPSEVQEPSQMVETKVHSQLQVKDKVNDIHKNSGTDPVVFTQQTFTNDEENRVSLNPYFIGVGEEQEEEERRALKHYDDIIYAYDRNESTSSFHGTKASRKPSQDSLPSYYKYSDARKFSAPYSLTTRRNPLPNPAIYQFSSLGRPRNRSELPAMLFRDSQRHKILYEDLRFINYGPNGYYETDDGPIFLYVAHMKPSDSKSDIRERDLMKPPSKMDLNKLKHQQYFPPSTSSLAVSQSPHMEKKVIPSPQVRRPRRTDFTPQRTNPSVYSYPVTRDPEVFRETNERRDVSFRNDNQGKWRESCEMELEVDFNSEEDNEESSDIDVIQPKPRLSRKMDDSSHYHRYVTKTSIQRT